MSIADQIARMRARWPRFALRNVDHKGRAARWIGIVQPNSPLTPLMCNIRLVPFQRCVSLLPVSLASPTTRRGNCHTFIHPQTIRRCAFLTPNAISGIGRCPLRIPRSRGPAIGLPVTNYG